MNDAQFLEAFDRSALQPGTFHHRDHVRLVWLALQEAPLLDAIARIRGGLLRLVKKLGAEDRYHDTITCALILIIHDRAKADPCPDWETFAQRNADLLEWNDGALLAPYYRRETLFSDLARCTFVLPDLLQMEVAA